MNIPMDEIFAFHAARTGCHIDTLNYFAQLIGYQFPEHDNDKNLEPYRTGYAYINYARHHPNCTVSPQQLAAFQSAHDEHHTMQPHHVRHYATMVDVPDVRIIEMVCDWFSANFEENAIVHTNTYANVMEFFDRKMAPLDWTPRQTKFIRDAIETISSCADYDTVHNIWRRLSD